VSGRHVDAFLLEGLQEGTFVALTMQVDALLVAFKTHSQETRDQREAFTVVLRNDARVSRRCERVKLFSSRCR